MRERRAHDWEVTWHDVISLEQSRVVWKNLGSKRIRKSLEWCQETWVPHSVHMVHTWSIEIKSMTSGHMYMACWPWGKCMVDIKIKESGLCFFLFYFLSHIFFFTFSIFRTLGLGLEVISHISHIWWCDHNIDHRTKEKEVEGSRTKWHHTTWTPYVGLMLYTWLFRVECTVASTDHL